MIKFHPHINVFGDGVKIGRLDYSPIRDNSRWLFVPVADSDNVMPAFTAGELKVITEKLDALNAGPAQ